MIHRSCVLVKGFFYIFLHGSKFFSDENFFKLDCVVVNAGGICYNKLRQNGRGVTAQSAISHQLKVLKDNNLVANRREGKTIYYFLADDHVRTIIGQGFEHLSEEPHTHGAKGAKTEAKK